MPQAKRKSWLNYVCRRQTDPGAFYDLCGEDLLINDSDIAFANMGYWDGIDHSTPDCLRSANFALFDRVNQAADISTESSVVLDVGCGFGVNTVCCQQQRRPQRTIGINVSKVQLDIARRHAHSQGQSDRVTFVNADATALPFADESVDRIICTEAAFHFDPRTAFFREAHRVLEPGGILSMADLHPLPPTKRIQRPALVLARHVLAIPAANVYSCEAYRGELEKAGFQIEQFASIYPRVHPPFVRWQVRQVGGWLRYPLTLKLAVFGFFFCPWDYLQVKAIKR